MAFSSLGHPTHNIDYSVSLTDNQLLELASLPKLAYLINLTHGWKEHGIIPGALVHLLQTCQLALVLDMRGYTEVLLDQESVPALATFFTSPPAYCKFIFNLQTHWGCEAMMVSKRRRIPETLGYRISSCR